MIRRHAPSLPLSGSVTPTSPVVSSAPHLRDTAVTPVAVWSAAPAAGEVVRRLRSWLLSAPPDAIRSMLALPASLIGGGVALAAVLLLAFHTVLGGAS